MSRSRSPFFTRRLRFAVTASASLLALSGAAQADDSAAETAACLEGPGTVRACSDKALSNVVVQCRNESGSFFVKYDELDDGTFEGLTSPYEGVFSCPEGDVVAIFIKSGRGRYDGPAIEGLPQGSGAAWTPLACAVDAADCASGDEEGGGDAGEEGGGDEAESGPE